MKIVLNEFVESLGEQGDELDVAGGYARNFLIPNKLAFEATGANVKTYRNNLEHRARKIAKILGAAEALKAQIEATPPLVFTRKTGEGGKLFGSITGADLESGLAARGFSIEKKRIALERPIKSLGATSVNIKLHKGVVATINVEALSEVEEKDTGEENGVPVENENPQKDTTGNTDGQGADN